ncbi:hypothetical protein G7K_2188-t1 [Saitoella complicata NRRL Y-17804]|uniref:Uncharacterized protein n=1 Tax=Saitoella complicata (strain BCRC 22490 / CBS 7301 / JCM 7358 / NBRC 10748 / NRRL Y-17804) TaxID=698492 RepID=A0A0E9NDW3_SAICN|nr:hypothetical protein G7K_2188-t1 [Saitoella complicata NRRL Y-17804]
MRAERVRICRQVLTLSNFALFAALNCGGVQVLCLLGGKLNRTKAVCYRTRETQKWSWNVSQIEAVSCRTGSMKSRSAGRPAVGLNRGCYDTLIAPICVCVVCRDDKCVHLDGAPKQAVASNLGGSVKFYEGGG